MSVITSADIDLDAAKNHINLAIDHLKKIVIEKEWGWKEFNSDYRLKLTNLLFTLLGIIENLE